MKKISSDQLHDLSRGSVFLATGGGGDPYVELMLAQRLLNETGPVEVISIADLDDDAYVVSIGALGAPSVALEMLPAAENSINTLKAFEAHVGRHVDAVISVEVGGANSLIPIMAAAGCKIPIVDGDGMGRAFPETQMMTFSIGGVCPTPALATDYKGKITTFSQKSGRAYEAEARKLALSSGGMIIAAEHPMSGAEVKRVAAPQTISFAQQLGAVLREFRGSSLDIIEPLNRLFEPSIYGEFRHIYSGKIVSTSTRTIGGYDVGEVKIQSFNSARPPLAVQIKNEFLVAECGGRVLAMVPDLITMVDFETSQPINAERLSYGQRVSVFAIGCPDYYRTDAALKAVGPRCFGFDFDYTPIEKIGMLTNLSV